MTSNTDETATMSDNRLLWALFALLAGLIVVGTEIAFNSPGATVTMAFAVVIGWLVWWLDL